MTKLQTTYFPLLSGVAALGRKMIEDRGEEGETYDPLECYGEWFMEDTSEAGYSEARADGRLSCRALTSIIRVDPDDLKKVKRLLGYQRNVYHDFALSQTVVNALSQWSDVAPAMHLILPSKRTPVRGPFHPKRRELRLNLSSNWSYHCLIVGKRSPEVRAASIKLAGLFRVNQADLNAVAATLLAHGASASALEGMLADVVLESVRTSPRFAVGLNWAQPA